MGALSRWPWDHRPNLILITLDALRRDHLGVYGDPRGLSPHLDAFAREATCYDAAYAPSSWTLASLGALATGLPSSRSGLMAVSATSRNHTAFYQSHPSRWIIFGRSGGAVRSLTMAMFLGSPGTSAPVPSIMVTAASTFCHPREW